MEWSEIKREYYFEDGSLRDIIADDMTIEKWIALYEFLSSHYDLQLFCDDSKINKNVDFPFEKVFKYDSYYHAWFCIKNVNFHLYFYEKNLELDLCPKEVNSLDKHTAILDFITQISILLKAKIKMTGENSKISLYEVDYT